MDNPWPESWTEETRARANRLLETMTNLGAESAAMWVSSEINENIAQLTRYMILRRVWQLVGSVEDIVAFLNRSVEEVEAARHSSLQPLGRWTKRVIDAGADLNDVGRIVRFNLIEVLFGVLEIIDEGYNPDLPPDDSLPGWALMETDAEGELTSRDVGGLHESFLSLDPSGQEGRME